VVCKQLGHVIVGYLRQVWDKNDWLYEEKHGFRPGSCCESQGRGFGIDAIIIDISKVSDLVPHDRLLTKLMASGVDSKVVIWVREVLVGRTQSQSRRATIQEIQSKLSCTARKRFGTTVFSSVRK
jgi:hypothetical protein